MGKEIAFLRWTLQFRIDCHVYLWFEIFNSEEHRTIQNGFPSNWYCIVRCVYIEFNTRKQSACENGKKTDKL